MDVGWPFLTCFSTSFQTIKKLILLFISRIISEDPPMNTLAEADFFGVDSWTETWELGGVTPMWTDAPSIGCEAGKTTACMEFVSYCVPSFY